ncbi:MAG: DNA-J related domain-containing protein [bacterium]
MIEELDLIAETLPIPGGVTSEFQILKALREKNILSEAKNDLELFQQHFVIMNALYRLQSLWLECELAVIDINSVKITVFPYQTGHSGILAYDKVREYYFDLNNLKLASKSSVEELIASFWKAYEVYSNKEPALKILGLKSNVSQDEIKQQVRRLTMKHHPDRGGDPEQLIIIRKAASQLLKP